jgi:hypothetical protein
MTVAMTLVIPVSTAIARGDGWEFLSSDDVTVTACGTQIHETVTANKEFAKFAVDPDGTLRFVLVTGVFKVRVTNLDTDVSTLVNASGTGHDALIYPNGDFLFTTSGPSLIVLSPEEAEQTGLPTLFVNTGDMDILFRADGSAVLEHRTGHLTDLCGVVT